MTAARVTVDALVRRMIEAQRQLSTAAGPFVAQPDPGPSDWLQSLEAVHQETLAEILDQTGGRAPQGTGETGDSPGAVLSRIGILANALNREVNALSDARLDQTTIVEIVERYLSHVKAALTGL